MWGEVCGLGKVWKSVLGCGGICKGCSEVLGEVWKIRCFGVRGGVEEVLGRCVKVCWSVGEVKREVWESVLGWGR